MNDQLTHADRNFFLGLYRSAVDFYQPRIEKRTGILLGKIGVRDCTDLRPQVMGDTRRRLGLVKAFLFRRRVRRLQEAWDRSSMENAQRFAAFYYRSTIYVPFFKDIRCHQEGVAFAAVHELSHALWERLSEGHSANSGE